MLQVKMARLWPRTFLAIGVLRSPAAHLPTKMSKEPRTPLLRLPPVSETRIIKTEDREGFMAATGSSNLSDNLFIHHCDGSPNHRLVRSILQGAASNGPRVPGITIGFNNSSNNSVLGYSFTVHRDAKLKVSDSSLKRLKTKLREATRSGRGRSLTRTIGDLVPLIRGWVGYYRLSEVRALVQSLGVDRSVSVHGGETDPTTK